MRGSTMTRPLGYDAGSTCPHDHSKHRYRQNRYFGFFPYNRHDRHNRHARKRPVVWQTFRGPQGFAACASTMPASNVGLLAPGKKISGGDSRASAAGRRVGCGRVAARDGWPGAGNADAAGGMTCPPYVGGGTDLKYAAIAASDMNSRRSDFLKDGRLERPA
jgi:hypothetical protein